MNVGLSGSAATRAMGLLFSQSGTNCRGSSTPRLDCPLGEERGEKRDSQGKRRRRSEETRWIVIGCVESLVLFVLERPPTPSSEGGEAFSPHIITSLISPVQSPPRKVTLHGIVLTRSSYVKEIAGSRALNANI